MLLIDLWAIRWEMKNQRKAEANVSHFVSPRQQSRLLHPRLGEFNGSQEDSRGKQNKGKV